MKNKIIKWSILGVILVVIIVLVALIYKVLFSSANNSRNTDIGNYKLSNNEINAVKDSITELEEVKNVDIHTNNNSRIIKILVTLKSDVNLDTMKKLANDSITNFSEENIGYYDFEFFIDSENQESTTYPQIGYKYRGSQEFSW